jgi:RNA polymerase sigma-70 factor (ECF subfamily)
MFLVEDRLYAVWGLEIVDGHIAGIRAVVNPDKLAHISSTTLPSLPPA